MAKTTKAPPHPAPRISRDTWVSLILLAFCGLMIHASFAIPATEYVQLQPSIWPRVVLGLLTASTLLLLLRSIVAPAPGPAQAQAPAIPPLERYRNAFWIFLLFLAFLLALPWTGMLLTGIAFVFLCLGIIGPRSPRSLLMHLGIAVLTVGFMWAVFTFVLHVFLPEGRLMPHL
ncbi:MAG: tripartite tricarboxylate transporter TctB family protein [Hyphomicrobiales bacterium]